MTKKQTTEKEEPGTALTNWEDKMAADARAVAKTERPSANKISFKSGVMSYMGNALPDNEIECIILAHVQEHVFYREKWKVDVVKPPACFALAMPGDKMRPHEVVEDPPGATCDECPMFKWGSDLEGGRGKACRERRRLAVIPRPDKIDEIAESDMATMSLPVMSVKQWANYVNKLSVSLQRPPWGVVTRVKLVPDNKSQFKVTFDVVEVLDSEVLPHIHPRIDLATSALMQPYDMEASSEEQSKDTGKKKY